MPVTINGSGGFTANDGSAAAPSIAGTDSNTGVFFPAADTVAIATGGSERLRVDSSGNVGIGTSSPRDVAGYVSLGLNDTTGGLLDFYANGTRIGGVIGVSGNMQVGTVTAIPLIFNTDTNERARIDSSGNLLVGTTNSNSSAFKLKVQAATDVCLGVASGTNIAGAMTLNAVNDANSANIALDFRSSSIYVSSGIGTTASAANAYFDSGNSNRFLRSTSALKYKTNIRDLESIDISKFRPVRYNSLCEADDPSKEHFGLIADEVYAAGITELVSYGADGEVEGFQYDRLTVVLVKAIQEQQALIESLTARIAALEAA